MGYLVHELHCLVEGQRAVLLVAVLLVSETYTISYSRKQNTKPLMFPNNKRSLRVVAAAAAVVADPNADVLDLGGLNLLDLVAAASGG